MAKKSKKVSTTSSEPKQALEAESSVLESNPDAEVVAEPDNTIVKVRAIVPFYDLKLQGSRLVGEEWEVTKDRAALLVKLGIAIVL
jgi:hypothetical protein